MMTPDSSELEVVEQVLRLTMRTLQGDATEAEKVVLEELLAQSALARRTYWRCIADELSLRTRTEEASIRTEFGQAAPPSETGSAKGPVETGKPHADEGQHWYQLLALRSGRGWKLAAMVAFVLVGGAVLSLSDLFRGQGHDVATVDAAPIASLVSAADVMWEMGRAAPQKGAALYPGKLSFRSGVAEFKFSCGATIVVEGPASLELIDSFEMQLIRGRLVMEIPEEASGFTVNTPVASVIDLGTSSGISVSRSGQTEVHVFDGLVELQADVANHEGRVRPVPAGKANLVDWTDSNLVVLDIPPRPEQFIHTLTPAVVIDPPGVRSRMVDGFNDALVTITDETCQPLTPQSPLGDGQESVSPQPYIAADFSLVEDEGVLKGKLLPRANDPQFHLPVSSPIDLQEFPHYRMRVWTAVDQSVATYYYGADGKPGVSRLSYEPPITAVARTWRELRHSFNAAGLLPEVKVSAFRVDLMTAVGGEEQTPFMIDYLLVDKYQTAALAEFDHDEDSEGWTSIGIDSPVVDSGVLRGKTITKGAKISHVHQTISPEKWTAIEVRMKLAPDAGNARFGWGRAGDHLEVERSVLLTNVGDGKFHTYIIGLEPHHGWSQLVTKFAIWFGDKGGREFEVDYIRALAVADVGNWIRRLPKGTPVSSTDTVSTN